MTLEEILAQVQMGGLSPEAAGKLIRQDGYKEMDYAKLDMGRKARTGFAEVIYCSNKADAHLLKIFERLYMEEGEVLGTRASQAQYELVKEKFPEVQYDPVSRILKIEKPDKIHEGKVAVCTAGTADIPVAEEAAQTAEYFGTYVERIYVFQAGDHSGCELCCGCGWHGGRSCQRYGRSCEQTGDRSTYVCGIWSEFPWIISTSDHDQFLCQWNCHSEY